MKNDTYILPCPHCDKVITVLSNMAGQSQICPDCGETIQIPKSLDELELLAEEQPCDAEETGETTSTIAEVIEPERTSCPFCQKPIMPGAIKCHHCDRIVDLKLKASLVQDYESNHAEPHLATFIEILFALFCAPIACIFALIWIFTGKTKQGLRMLLFVIIAPFVWVAIKIFIMFMISLLPN